MNTITLITILSGAFLLVIVYLYLSNTAYLRSINYWYANSTYICNMSAHNIQTCYNDANYYCFYPNASNYLECYIKPNITFH